MTAHPLGAFDDAACTDHPDLDEVFFPTHPGPANHNAEAEALKVCGGCSCRRDCLMLALSLGNVQGIWGGTTHAQRDRIRHHRKGIA